MTTLNNWQRRQWAQQVKQSELAKLGKMIESELLRKLAVDASGALKESKLAGWLAIWAPEATEER